MTINDAKQMTAKRLYISEFVNLRNTSSKSASVVWRSCFSFSGESIAIKEPLLMMPTR